MCKYCGRDLRVMWLTEVEALLSALDACERAKRAAEAELAARLKAGDHENADDEQR